MLASVQGAMAVEPPWSALPPPLPFSVETKAILADEALKKATEKAPPKPVETETQDETDFFVPQDSDVDANESPKIIIVIDDMGVKKSLSRRFMTLPSPLTFSFLPYASGLPEQMAVAKKSGHDVMIHVPMEPQRPIDEPMLLRVSMNDAVLKKAVSNVLNVTSDVDGVNNHMGSRFTADSRAMSVFFREVKSRNLFFLDSLTCKKSVGTEMAKKHNVPYIVRDVFIDNVRHKTNIHEQLVLLEEKALEKGMAVGIGHPHESTLDALSEWIPQAKAKGFVFLTVKDAVFSGPQKEQ